VYVGAGDKMLTARRREEGERRPRLGAHAVGRRRGLRSAHAALINVVRALDRQSGNQRWHIACVSGCRSGCRLAHVVFVPTMSTDLPLVRP
jgi:hypothetical protein